MLRRKLLLNLGPIVLLLLITAVAAIWLLQGTLQDLNHVNSEAWQVVNQVNELSINVNAIEVDLYELQLGKQRHLDSLIEKVESTRQIVQSLEQHYLIQQGDCLPLFKVIRDQMPGFAQNVSALVTAQDPEVASRHGGAALNSAVVLRQSTLPLSRYVRAHAHAEQEALLSSFHWIVLGLALVFLLVINVSVIVLLRIGSMILQPVDKLVEATRQLGAEHFAYRVRMDQNDEFDELARAYNLLAEQLQANEQKRIETLAQVAVTMNHELNNAIAIIDLQLAVIRRQSAGSPAPEKCLLQIQESLQRMTRTIQALKNVRRIVLTDYAPGTKMLDLQKSLQLEQQSDSPLHTDDPVRPTSQTTSAGTSRL